MDYEAVIVDLQRHVASSLAVLSHGVAQLDGDRDAFLAAQPTLRQEMGAALSAYQAFKHGVVFDPGIASGDAARASAARDMKISCIKASETFRVHMSTWPRDRIERDWGNYRVAARLTANRLSRHIRDECEDVEALIRRYGA